VISKDEMMDGMLQACPSFRPDWDAFLEEWRSDADKPLYLALGALARHLIAMLAAEDTGGLIAAFEVVERWHLEETPSCGRQPRSASSRISRTMAFTSQPPQRTWSDSSCRNR
jgi:hypothetical protein